MAWRSRQNASTFLAVAIILRNFTQAQDDLDCVQVHLRCANSLPHADLSTLLCMSDTLHSH